MATRNLTMVVDRQHAEHNELGFAANPAEYFDKSYVNMYLHHDGYPDWQGVQLANWCKVNGRQDGSALAAKLVHDHYYDSCYLYSDHRNIDHHYTYIIWTGKPDIWISCWNQYSSRNIFVMQPDRVIERFKNDMDYTDFANGEIRNDRNTESNKVNLSLDNVEKAMSALLICNNILKKSITD